MEIRAHAKVNLDLRVLGSRPDGFHELRTVFQSIDLHDTLTCVERPGPFTLRCRAAGVPLDRTNLVWRAAALLWQDLGREGEPHDVTVTIQKRIPLESGLGGGSADAAAALRALARLWSDREGHLRLRELAARLGADVPFFLAGGTALGLGRGDEIYPLVDLPGHWIVVVRPPFGVSTREAYALYDDERSTGYRGGGEPQLLPTPWPSRAAQMVNDLEAPIARRHPEIGRAKSALRELGAVGAAMTGSGSAIFGLFRARRDALRAAAVLRRPGWIVLLSRTLNREAHARRARPILQRTRRVR